MVYVIQVCRQLLSRIRMELHFHPDRAARKLAVWYIPLLSVQWINPDDGQRNRSRHVEFHFQNKFEKLVRLVGFIIRKFVTMHGHMNVKKNDRSCYVSRRILAPRPPWLQKHSNLLARDMAHSPGSWHQARPADVTCAWSRRYCGISPVVGRVRYYVINRCCILWDEFC
jgi:hypothetical protein